MSQKKAVLQDSGERMVPAYHKGHMVYGEHIVRYEAVAPLVKHKVVLDIASGSGYGTASLAKSAKEVVGVDIDQAAVVYSQKNYAAANIRFLQGSGTEIPLEDSSVDVVVSFETLEHIEDYEAFMAEIKRVLKDDGLLIISTPNDIEFPESNHFHIHEFEQKELEKLVGIFFKNTKLYFQATWKYNALLSEELLSKGWRMDVQTLQTAPVASKKAIYFYMLCANRTITEKSEPLAAISEHWSERRVQANDTSIRKLVDEQGAIIKHLENSLQDNKNVRQQLENQLHAIQKSKLYKLAKRARALKRRLSPKKS